MSKYGHYVSSQMRLHQGIVLKGYRWYLINGWSTGQCPFDVEVHSSHLILPLSVMHCNVVIVKKFPGSKIQIIHETYVDNNIQKHKKNKKSTLIFNFFRVRGWVPSGVFNCSCKTIFRTLNVVLVTFLPFGKNFVAWPFNFTFAFSAFFCRWDALFRPIF